MPTTYRADVYVQESASASFAPTAQVQTTAVFAGPHQQGPTVPTLIASWAQFQAIFGGFGPGVPTYLALAVYSYFLNGGGRCQILRVPHTGAGGTVTALATLNLKDAGAATTITVNAANPGVWGNSIYIQVSPASDGIATHFNLSIYYGGTTALLNKETWVNLAMSQSDANGRYFASMLNNINTGSQYITVVDVEGTTTTPGNVPVTLAATVLAGGVDGTATTDTEILNALPLLNNVSGPLLLNIPGNSDAAAIAGAQSYAQTRNIAEDVFVVIDPPVGTAATSALATQGITGCTAAGATATGSYFLQNCGATDCSAVYWPWLLINDPSNSVPGAVRLVPPGGAVMGMIVKNDQNNGCWKAPAGVRVGALQGVVGLQYTPSNADLDNLNYNNVNAIKPVTGSGLVVWGARTLSSLVNSRYINVRRLLTFIETTVQQTLQAAIFESNDAVLWQSVTVTVDTFLGGLFADGAFAGTAASLSYFITCDSTVNTPTTIASGQLICVVGVAPVIPAEFIILQISQWQNGSASAAVVTS